jgi:hypothetical protein
MQYNNHEIKLMKVLHTFGNKIVNNREVEEEIMERMPEKFTDYLKLYFGNGKCGSWPNGNVKPFMIMTQISASGYDISCSQLIAGLV